MLGKDIFGIAETHVKGILEKRKHDAVAIKIF
uniref:Uncharacterized protein n=1 Tax=Rhizophora mucronata TaxID=61149 RepID=A0A2P2NAR2_RHIMU